MKKMTLEEIKKELGYDFVIVTEHSKVKLAEMKPGDRFTGPDGREWAFITTTDDGGIAAIPTQFVFENEQFDGNSNNFANSDLLQELNDEVLPEIGEENLKEFALDLTSLDGLKDYGEIKTKVGLMTYKFYVEHQDIVAPVLKELDDWVWLATPLSTPKRGVDCGGLCVAPLGCVRWGRCIDPFGVLPFCIFNSDIFVSDRGVV